MSCAIPVIVYDNGALGSAVSNSNGFLVRTGDTEALAEAILELYLKTPEERSVMAEGSRQFASKTDLNLTSKIKEGWFLEIVSKYKKK
jgi:glycosyltransferase involved in cell wall biosynthesis